MKNLDKINPTVIRPRSFASAGALMPFFSGILCIPLAVGAAPHLSFWDNILGVSAFALSVASVILVVIPHIFRWDWRSKFFGVSLLYVGSVGFLGIVPWLGIVCYSALPATGRLMTFALYFLPLMWWCRRFVVYYRRVFADPSLRSEIYAEEDDAIYYLQLGDKRIAEKKLILQQFPSVRVVVASVAMSISLVPFASRITALSGTSFFHIFLTVLMIPIVLMCFGLAVKGYLVFYYYPWKLKRLTGKEVFVIMAIADQKS